MTSTCGPFQATPGGCQPKTEVFWAQKPADASPVLLYLQTPCLGGLASRALTRDKDGLVPAVGYTEADKLANALKRERGASCQDPVHVAVCEPGAVSVEALDAEACDGTTLSVQAKAIAEQVVNAPGTALLVKMICDEKLALTAAEWFCASGVPISRSDTWDISVSPRALIGSIWQDVSGAVVPAPAAGSYAVGDCSCVNLTAAQRGIQSTW